MKTSDSIVNIAQALLKAQRAITFAVKDSKNPHFKSTYADLGSVIGACKAALNESGIVFMQMPSPSESGTIALTTRLLHSSGEWIEDTATCPLQKSDPQGYGSANTYLRRYALAAAVGLYQDDDDGHAASTATANVEEVNRTNVMKVRSAIQEHLAEGRDMGVLEEWEAAQERGPDFCKGVWSGLTTPERDAIRKINDNATAKA